MKTNLLKLWAAGVMITILLGACGCGERNDDTLLDQFLEADAGNEQLTQFEDDGAEAALDSRVADSEVAGLLSSGGCATVTRDTLSTPRRITIDFGAVNCLCRDGRYRRGMVYVDYTGQRGVPGSTATLSYSGYFVNDRGISGSRTISYSSSPGGNPQRTNTYNITVTPPNQSGSYNRQGQRVREKIAGDGTASLLDDVYLISGSGTGSRTGGLTYSHTILTPLRREGSCAWTVSGSIQFSRNNRLTRTLDFGNGSCDDQATVSNGTRTRTISLP
ncbi:MAG: hypothetical protein ACKO6M_02820 [Bacteroidota bacterium]